MSGLNGTGRDYLLVVHCGEDVIFDWCSRGGSSQQTSLRHSPLRPLQDSVERRRATVGCPVGPAWAWGRVGFFLFVEPWYPHLEQGRIPAALPLRPEQRLYDGSLEES